MKRIFLTLLVLPLSLRAQFERPEDTAEMPLQRHVCTYQAEVAYWNLVEGNISPYLHDTVEYSQERRGKKHTKKRLDSKRTERKLSRLLSKGRVFFSGKSNSGYIFSLTIFDLYEEREILHTVKFKVDHFYQKIVSIEVLREFPDE